jgi:hypothetical protein
LPTGNPLLAFGDTLLGNAFLTTFLRHDGLLSLREVI